MANEPRLAVESIAGLRPYQEDSLLAQSLSDGRVLVAVADGMGGHAAGEVASALALETLLAALEAGKPLDDAFVMANSEVHRMAQEPGKQGMGTTLVAALIEDGEYMVANVGDSRGYLLSQTGIRQVTEDHSFVAEAVKRGQSLEEAMATPWRDALTRSIGTEEAVDVDVFGPFPVQEDTALLICSDGLYKTLSDADLNRIFLQSGSTKGAAQTLVSAAFDSGSDDNISVAIAEYGEVPRSSQGTMPLDFVPDPEDDPAADTDSSDATAVGWEPVSSDAETPDDDDAGTEQADALGEAGPDVETTDPSLRAIDETMVDPLPAVVSDPEREETTPQEVAPSASAIAGASGLRVGVIVVVVLVIGALIAAYVMR